MLLLLPLSPDDLVLKEEEKETELGKRPLRTDTP